MCGIVGYSSNDPTPADLRDVQKLFWQSSIRGLHAFGYASYLPEHKIITVYRTLKFGQMVQAIAQLADGEEGALPLRLLTHARYDLSGDYHRLGNNQPLYLDETNTALAFNGVISMATKPEFEREFGVQCSTENDGEILLRLMQQGVRPEEFTRQMRGSFAGILLQGGELYALRNERRPLWFYNREDRAFFYASTRDIFLRAGFPGCTSLEPNQLYAAMGRGWAE